MSEAPRVVRPFCEGATSKHVADTDKDTGVDAVAATEDTGCRMSAMALPIGTDCSTWDLCHGGRFDISQTNQVTSRDWEE